jgi:hypothetical protein
MQADINQLLVAIGALSDKVSAMDAKLTALDSKVNTVVERLDKIEGRLDKIEANVLALNAAGANERVRAINRVKANVAALEPFLFDCSGEAWPPGVKQPPTLLDLAVAGNENKPGLRNKPAWNKTSSIAFLKAAVAGFLEDASDGEGESGTMARTVRVKVIQAVGGDVASVFATQYQFV